ncbi:hypothetical protein [Absidia glauca]|uniref:Uncharacterized protein n=1 Tax=Absidia glauca TaxID=4829 RepID=A0A163MR12_ABSGL|nr:hypothetical protein [Absidia glauca]
MSSNQRTNRRPAITMEDPARMIRKDRMEILALRELLETHLERLAPPAASQLTLVRHEVIYIRKEKETVPEKNGFSGLRRRAIENIYKVA